MLSFLALVVALSGSAYAVSKVTGKDVQNKSLTGKDVKPDSLSGKQIAEAKLGTVPSATSAERANVADVAGSASTAQSAATAEDLAGFDVVTIAATQEVDNPGGSVPIAEVGGLRINMGCNSAVGANTRATTATDNARIRSTLTREAGGAEEFENEGVVDRDFDSDEFFRPTELFGLNGLITIVYARPLGSGAEVATATYSIESGPGNFCHASGHAFVTTP